jgi:hypothetical protein
MSHGMLERFRANLARETSATASNIALIEQDVCRLPDRRNPVRARYHGIQQSALHYGF